ncbi:MAG: SulP family inorganic anion transporter [Gemmataceae bacterium]
MFLVALPLCLGVALASNAPLLLGWWPESSGGCWLILSGSHSSESGPAAGLTAVVAVQIQTLGSFQSLLLVVVIAGLIQVVLGVARLGLIAEFIPSSVIKGLLTTIGLAVGVFFVLLSNLRSPLKRTVEQSASGGEVVRIELPNQVSFLNRAALSRALHEVPRGGHVILDARASHYVDPDVIEMIRDFKELTDPPYDVTVSLLGFNGKYGFEDHVQYETATAGVGRVAPTAYESGSTTAVIGAG